MSCLLCERVRRVHNTSLDMLNASETHSCERKVRVTHAMHAVTKQVVMAALKGEKRKCLLTIPTGAACSKLICALLAIGVGPHAWLHSDCWAPWRARRRAEAIDQLAAKGIEVP
jgi:hypothetical protein